MYENQDDIEENRYYLDDVDVNEIIFYADDINQNSEKIEIMNMKETFETMLNPLKTENENLKKEIQELKNNNKNLKNKIHILRNNIKDEIQTLHKNDKETKSQIAQIQKSFQLLIKIEYFNNLSIKAQHFIVSELIKVTNEQNTQFFMKFKVLIDFILDYINNDNESLSYIKILQEKSEYLNEINDGCQIFIYKNLLDIIDNFQNNRGYYFYLRNVFMNFNCVIWEIEYPSENFQNKYNFVSDIKESLERKIKIQLFINDETNSTYENNDKIDFLEFGPKIKNIEDNSFNGCTSLKKIIIPSSINSIGSSSFSDCTSLEKVMILEKSQIVKISHNAFKNCISLTSFEIPSTVTYLGKSIFRGCSSLKMIKIPDSVTAIRENSFYNCLSLERIQMHHLISTIAESAFKGCSSLTKIEIPESVKKINENTFNGCTSLTFLKIPTTVESIESNAFSNCSNLEKIEIDPFVTHIKSDSFINCPSLTHLTIILKERKSIQTFDFPLKNQITYIKFPKMPLKICQFAFTNWPSLREVDVGRLTLIENNAFKPDIIITRNNILMPGCYIC